MNVARFLLRSRLNFRGRPKFRSLTPPSRADYRYDPDAKWRALPPRKVCIICSCVSLDSDDDYHIYIVDLNSRGVIAAGAADEFIDIGGGDDFIPRAPTLRLNRRCFDAGAFCVLNSTLYMFEGYDRDTNSHGKSVVTFDLSSANVFTNSSLKLKRSVLGNAPDMLHTKDSPVATRTPDGKILVFSALIRFVSSSNFDSSATAGKKIDFELYDPTIKSWHKLPGICDDWGDDKNSVTFWIQAYSFLSKSVLFLQTQIGMFTLDLESPDSKGWKQLDSFANTGARSIPFTGGSFLVIEDELCLTPLGAYDIKKRNGFSKCFHFPLSSFGDANYVLPISSAITPLDNVDDGQCNFCVIQTGLNRDTEYPHQIIDVCSCDLIKYKADKQNMGDSAQLSTSIVKSFKFILNDQRCYSFFPFGMFSI